MHEPLGDEINELREEYNKLGRRRFDAMAGMIQNERSSLPMVAVPPAQTPDDGAGIPSGKPAKHK